MAVFLALLVLLQVLPPLPPSLDSLLNSLLSGNSLNPSSLTDLISQLTKANGGSFDIGSISNLLSSLMGGNTLTLDLNAVIKLVSGLIGGSAGNLDVSKIAELAGNLLQGGDIGITQIVQLVSGLIGGSTGSLDTSSVNLLASNLMSNASSNLDIGAITDLLSGLISNSGNIDAGTIAQTVAQSLMPLLASIDTGNSSIDMNQLTQVLPTVVCSVTTLVSAISSAGSGNVPDTIADVLKGINPLLNLLANNDVLDADQAEIVNTLYDVLNGVQVVLDFVNNPSLLTLSSDLNNVITALKPVIALIDSKGQFSDLLDGVQCPEIGDLLGSLGSGVPSLDGLGLDAFTDSVDNLVGNNSSLQLPDLSELISGISNTDTATNISITEILPTIKETITNLSSGSSLPKFDFSSLLSGFSKTSDIDQTSPLGLILIS
ncbi:hypothetical protein J504_1341 [Acinetobacter baumannii 348935]|nr:hypothetical protein J504_1341 [Acinetobacter baumannii 348935]